MKPKWRNKDSALADSLYLMVLQGMNQLLPIIILPYLMKVLGERSYGYIGFSLSFIQYMVLIVDFGFNFSATKRIAQSQNNPDEVNRIFWAVVWDKVCLLLACTAAMLILIHTVPTFSLYGKAILYTYPMVLGSTFTFMWIYQGIGKVRSMAIINTLSKLLLLPLIFLFVKSEKDFLLAALLQSSVYVLTALVSCLYLWHLNVIGKPQISIRNAIQEMKESTPLFLSSASSSIYTQLFIVVLGFYCSTEAVGRYAAAERIMRCLCFGLFTPIYQAFFPHISKLCSQGRHKAMPAFKTACALMGLCMVAVTLFLSFGATFIQRFLGAGYTDLEALLHLISPTPIFIGMGGVFGLMGLIAMGDRTAKKHFCYVYMAAAVVAFTIVIVLTQLLQEFGTALSLLLTELMVCLMMAYYFKKDIGFSSKKLEL